MNKRTTRRESREMLNDFKMTRELYKIIKHFFPSLMQLLKNVKEPRNKSYITYHCDIILLLRILSSIFHIGSMRQITTEFNNEICHENISNILNIEKLAELPHWSTINDFLEKLDPKELESIIPNLVKQLIRMRSFEDSRIRKRYWQIVIDGTNLYHFSHPHCPHCLSKTHKNDDGSIKYIEYYHYVLEAKLVLNNSVVISIATEFVENESPDVAKQDCELKAFYRLADKLKKKFPKLPMCLTMDSLYACKPVFDKCRQYNFRYIIRFKDGSIKSIADDFHALKDVESSQIITKVNDGSISTYKYVNEIQYENHSINAVEFFKSSDAYPFVFITDLPLTRKNCEKSVEIGRLRWRIENEGFNNQINHGYFLEHMFSKNYTAMKNHYFLIQIAHMISQLFEIGTKIMKEAKLSIKALHSKLKMSFQNKLLTKFEIDEIKNEDIRIRFC